MTAAAAARRRSATALLLAGPRQLLLPCKQGQLPVPLHLCTWLQLSRLSNLRYLSINGAETPSAGFDVLLVR